MPRCPEEFAHVSAGSLHPEHLVGLAYVHHQTVLHQIGSECYFRGIQTVVHQNILKQGCIQHYVAVIGHECMSPAWSYILYSAAGESGNAVFNDSPVQMVHNLELEIPDTAYRPDHIPDFLHRPPRKHERGQGLEERMVGDTVHRSRNLAVAVWTYIIKHAPCHFQIC